MVMKELEDLKTKKKSRKVGAVAAAKLQEAAAAAATSVGEVKTEEAGEPVLDQGSTLPPAGVDESNSTDQGKFESASGAIEAEITTDVPSPSSPEVFAPKPETPAGARELASQALDEMGLSSNPGSGTDAATSTALNDSLPPNAGPDPDNSPVSSSFVDMLEGNTDDIMADRIMEDGSQIEIVDKKSLVEGRQQIILDAMKAEEEREAKEKMAQEAALKLTPEQAEVAIRLHPAADHIVIQSVEKDDVANVIIELMLNVFDNWKEGYLADAADELEEVLAIASTSGPNNGEHSSVDFCRHIYTLLELDTPYSREVREVNDKFQAVLAYLDRRQEQEEKNAETEKVSDTSSLDNENTCEEVSSRDEASSPSAEEDLATLAKSSLLDDAMDAPALTDAGCHRRKSRPRAGN